MRLLRKVSPPSNKKNLLSTSQAARRMGISSEAVRTLCNKRILSGAFQQRPGGPWLIPEQNIIAWLANPTYVGDSFPNYQASRSRPQWYHLIGKAITRTTAIFGLFAILSVIADVGPARQQLADWGIYYPIASERESEILIVISTFEYSEGVINTQAHREIKNAISSSVKELGVPSNSFRVEIIPQRIDVDDYAAAEAIARKYNAHVIVWGGDTGARVTVNFLHLKSFSNFIPISNMKELFGLATPDTATLVSVDEVEKNQIGNPYKYTQFITSELPSRLSFLSMYAIGQSNFPNKPKDCIEALERGIKLVQNDAQDLNANYYYWLGMCYLEDNNFELSRKNFETSTTYDPLNPFYLMGLAYTSAKSSLFDDAIDNFSTAITQLSSSEEPVSDIFDLNIFTEMAYVGRGDSRYAKINTLILQQPEWVSFGDFKTSNPELTFLDYVEKYYKPYHEELKLVDSDYFKGMELVFQRQGLEYFMEHLRILYLSRSFVLLELGEFEGLLQLSNQMSRDFPSDPVVFKMRYVAYEALGEYDLAYLNFKLLASISPEAENDAVSQAFLKNLESKINQP